MKHYRKMEFKQTMVICAILGFFMVIPFESMAQHPDHVPIAIIGDLTGPYAVTIGPFAPGTEDGVKYINEKLGGINGVKIKLYSRDMQGKVALGLQQYAELMTIRPKPLFLGLMHSPLAEALREKLKVDGVIGLSTPTIKTVYPQGNMYGHFALYPEGPAAVLKMVRENWKENRNPRIGVITWDSAYGRSFLTDEFFSYCKQIGVDIVGTELFKAGDVDVTTQLIRLRALKPDFLATNTLGNGPLSILKVAKELGWKIQLLAGFGIEWGGIRLDPELYEGVLNINNFGSFDDTDHPGIKFLLDQLKKNNRGIHEKTGPYIFGWQTALTAQKAIKDAVDKVGWANLNADAVRYGMNNMNCEFLDGVLKVEYSEKIRTNPWAIIYKVEGGKMISVNPGGKRFIRTPDLRPNEFR